MAFSGVAFFPFGHQREIDHHDRVLFHDADQQQHTDQGNDGKFASGQNQRQQRAHPGRWQGGEDGDWMDEAFIQYSQHDIDGDKRQYD